MAQIKMTKRRIIFGFSQTRQLPSLSMVYKLSFIRVGSLIVDNTPTVERHLDDS